MTPRTRRILAGLSVLMALGLSAVAVIYIMLWDPLISAGKSAIVGVQGGLVQGLTQNGVAVYRGIPFAAPPVGDLRWRAPQAVNAWEGVRDSSVFSSACMQSGETVPGLGIEPTAEDCLYLNVWTPARLPETLDAPAAQENLPVMVWLYGGGHHVGSGSARLYWGDKLTREDVVVVTLNYRLGAFGMLAHPDLSAEAPYGASGNYLLLDQIAALQWVQQNIGAFGGDPNNVTIFGQSAGASSVSRLLVSPLTRGLFHRAIAQSGGDLRAEAGTVPLERAEAIGVEFAQKLGVTSLSDLRAVSAQDILAADVVDYFDNGTPQGPTQINVDGYVLPDTVRALYAQGLQHDVPLLVGSNSGDDPAMHPESEENWSRLHAMNGGKVYGYYFTRVPPYPPFRFRGIAGHGAELIYLFGFPPPIFFYAVDFPWNAPKDVAFGDAMRSYWTNFAKTGNPNGESLPNWPAFDADEKIIEFGDVIEASTMVGD